MMDDTTLERGLRARPPADPVYRSRITATPSAVRSRESGPRHAHPVRTRPMLTASRLIAALAIAVLGAGALFVAASQPSVPLPSPSPSASLTPSPVLVTEVVAPGVERVIGLREASSPASPWVLRFEEPGDVSMNHTGVGPNGTIWMLETDRLVRLDTGEHWSRAGVGKPDQPSWVPGIRDDIQVAADGTVFMTSWPIRSFSDTDWATERDGYLFPGQADGAIWAYREDQLTRWDGDRWTEWTVPGVLGGSPYAAVATVDGTAWLGRLDGERPTDVGYIWVLARFDGATLTDVTVPGVPADVSPILIAAGPDGTLWVYLWSRAGTGYLARLAADEWTVFDAEDGVPIARDFYQGLLGSMAVGPDGRVWLTPQDEPQDDCGGVASFDGATWTPYLPDACVVDLDVARDGTAWVQTAVAGTDGVHLAGPTYRITPGR